MKNFACLFFYLLMIAIPASAQDKTLDFPFSFVGKWKGTMQWMVTGKTTQTFTMQLRILPTDSTGIFTWQIIYGDREQDNRPYLLKPIDTAKGHWVIDENNSIILDNYVFGNCLKGAFTVSGNTIADNYCLENGQLKVEFTSIKLADKNTTGTGTGDAPHVDSYRITSYQVGILNRIN